MLQEVTWVSYTHNVSGSEMFRHCMNSTQLAAYQSLATSPVEDLHWLAYRLTRSITLAIMKARMRSAHQLARLSLQLMRTLTGSQGHCSLKRLRWHDRCMHKGLAVHAVYIQCALNVIVLVLEYAGLPP